MAEIFDTNEAKWSYEPIVPNILRSTQLPLPVDERAKIEYPTHSSTYWVKAMKGQDFSGPDRINPISFNRALWRGLNHHAPYPVVNLSHKVLGSDGR